MAKDKRFEKVEIDGMLSSTIVFMDTETGVNYLFVKEGYAGGLTPLLDKDGKPIITPSNK